MSISVLILGESGTGKTCSLRNLDPKDTLLIQPVRKPLPFRSNWHEIKAKGDGGNIFVCNDSQKIVSAMHRAPQSVIVIDDFQYVLISILMARRAERSFDKFSDIAGSGYDLVSAASQLSEEKRVYVLCHTETDDFGNVRAKSIGKMLTDKICIEGLFTITLRTHVENNHYTFQTHNSGQDTVKTPLQMFEADFVENDLAAVDATICEYYGISSQNEEEAVETAESSQETPDLSEKLAKFQERIHATMDMTELKKIGAEIKALGLPDDSDDRKELLSAWEKQKERILDTLNDIQ